MSGCLSYDHSPESGLFFLASLLGSRHRCPEDVHQAKAKKPQRLCRWMPMAPHSSSQSPVIHKVDIVFKKFDIVWPQDSSNCFWKSSFFHHVSSMYMKLSSIHMDPSEARGTAHVLQGWLGHCASPGSIWVHWKSPQFWAPLQYMGYTCYYILKLIGYYMVSLYTT